MKYLTFTTLLAIATHALGQQADTIHTTYPYARAHLDDLKELLAIPNDAHHPDDIARNVVRCAGVLEERGFSTKRLETSTLPLLLATYHRTVADAPTVLFYFHIDGQPVDPEYWFQEDPYTATLKQQVEGEGWVAIPWERLQRGPIDPEWRIFARSSSDDKSPFIMFLAALKTLEENSGSIPYNLKVILDFEEEIGSPNLPGAVVTYAADLASDMLIIFDGPKHSTNRPTIAFGARGITTMTITVFGPTFPQHSGHYGNYAPNPATRLAHLLASMKDDHGRVTIPGYYDGITLDAETKAILAAVPDDERVLKVKLGGTLPTSPFINTLGVPAVIVPLVNDDNNQHSPNENLRLGNYFDGVKTLYALLIRPVQDAD